MPFLIGLMSVATLRLESAIVDSKRPTTSAPRAILVISGLVVGAGVLIALVGAVTVGTTWDERVQLYMLQAFFDKGWHTGADIINGVPDPTFYFGTYVYGPVGELLPHFVNVVLGREELWGALSDSADAYAGRHIGIALWGVIGLAASGCTVGVITRSWRWGAIGSAALASIPLWTGHAMFNIKDTPTATGYILFTLGLVALLDSRYFTDRRIRVTALTSTALGLVVVIGTRTALTLPLIMTLPLVMVVLLILSWRQSDAQRVARRIGRRFTEGIAAYVLAYLLLVVIYPKAFLNPVEVGIKSLLDSALYPVNEAQLVNGEWMVQPVSWLYQPLWFGAQLPLLVLLGLLGFLIWWIVRAVQAIGWPPTVADHVTTIVQTTPLLLQISIVPLAAIVGHSTLYNGTRQMLFVLPAAAVLAVLALHQFTGWSPLRSHTLTRRGTWVVVGIGLLVPIGAQIQLFPYGYTYVNAIAALKPVDGNWPTDYWRASGRELLRNTPLNGRDSCGFEQLQKGEIFPCTEQPMFIPYLKERGLDAAPLRLQSHEYWFIRENSGVLDMPPGCRLETVVSRPLFWQNVTIGQIAVCDDRIDTGLRNLADPSLPAEKR